MTPAEVQKLKAVLRNAIGGSKEYDSICEMLAEMEDGASDDDPSDLPDPSSAKTFAMDAASVRDPVRQIAGYTRAKAHVEAVLGRPVLAMDTAEVFREGIAALGADASALPAPALPTMFSVLARGRGVDQYGNRRAPRPTPAETRSFNERFPEAARIRII
jgi:hypothetical protein